MSRFDRAIKYIKKTFICFLSEIKMSNNGIGFGGIFLISLYTSCLYEHCPISTAYETKRKINHVEDDVNQLESKIRSVDYDVDQLESKVRRLQSEVDNLERGRK